ncbi:DUF551 domain-containing protein [Eikenella sp. Marseille-P7795]|uniref:DUF551 domain-containing protein n=1 Tax=Eikenella sp. Marseille-P7795 TaxID=2866577 RepID=UPI001CE441A2|nr:DUF551 domain-containing protein [Eikenella sp. Marseille-P7795]
MTPERIEERKAFEAWMAELYPTNPQTERVGDEYSRLGTQYKWEGWQAKAARPEWISVKDRLPESSKRYLTFSSFYMQIVTAYYSVERGMWLGVCRTDEITHWQPFPAPPTTNPAA